MANYDYNDEYIPNRACRCWRCSSRWLMGPTVLITIGVMFLLQQMHIFWFRQTFPVLLIVIGLVRIAQRSAPDSGHIQPPPYYPPGIPIPPSPPPAASNRSDSEVMRG